MKIALSAILVTFLSMMLLACTKPERSDYDILCDIFDSVSKAEATMSGVDLGMLIAEKVKTELNEASSARVLWGAVHNAAAEERYEIFKYSAEGDLEKPWHCTSMKLHAGKIEYQF